MTAVSDTRDVEPGHDEPVNVRVSSRKRKYLYVDFARHRLHEGAPEVIVSGLGSAMSDAVSVAEMMKNKDLVVVQKIHTSRVEVTGSRSNFVDKIEITLSKSAKFDAVYEEQERARQEGRHTEAREQQDDE